MAQGGQSSAAKVVTMADTGGSQSQVRLQLITRDSKLVLPESVGPILVPSCKTTSLLRNLNE